MVRVIMSEKEIVVVASMSQISDLCHVLKKNKVKHKYTIVHGGVAFPKKYAFNVLYEMSTMFRFTVE